MKRLVSTFLLIAAGAALCQEDQDAKQRRLGEKPRPFAWKGDLSDLGFEVIGKHARAVAEEAAKAGFAIAAQKGELEEQVGQAMKLAAQARIAAEQELGQMKYALAALPPQKRDREQEREQASIERNYQRAMKALDDRRWEEASDGFAEIAKRGTTRADAALYWKAYADNKRGQRDHAIAAIEELRKSFPSSRWLNDAKALEVEVRQAAGRPVTPESESDEELKLMAINALVHSDPERAIPLLEKLLKGGTYSPKLKERALFVLTQSGSTRAQELIGQIARGDANPDLQMKALRYLGTMGGRRSRDLLAEIYASSNDFAVKRTILQSFMTSGDRERLFNAAKDEKSVELRREAINQLGVSGGQAELWQLYGVEPTIEVKAQILNAMFVAGNADKLIELARTEKEPKLRREAINKLGVMGSRRTGDALVSIYGGEADPAIRREIINSLFIQGNAKAMVDLARKETDLNVKKEIVQKLSHMKSKDATDYMLEILNK